MRALECFLSTHRCPRLVVWFLICNIHNSKRWFFFLSRTLYLCLFLVVEHWKNGLVPVSGGADNPLPFGTSSSGSFDSAGDANNHTLRHDYNVPSM